MRELKIVVIVLFFAALAGIPGYLTCAQAPEPGASTPVPAPDTTGEVPGQIPADPVASPALSGEPVAEPEFKVLPVKVNLKDLEVIRLIQAKIAVLKSVVQEQEEGFRREQAVFADRYGLDLGRLRAGKYLFDLKTGGVRERP